MSILDKYYRISSIAGINLELRQDGLLSIHFCVILVKGNSLHIEKKVTDLVSTEELKKHLPLKSLVAVNISGKGVLNRQTEKIEEIDQQNFTKILPNARVDDFYVQNFISGDQSFVSVIRQSEADKWINHLKTLGYEPLSLSLGPFVVEQIVSQLNIYGNELIFNGNIIQRNDQLKWTGYQTDPAALTPFALKVENEGVNEKLIVPYAAAFQMVLSGSLDLIKASVETLDGAFSRLLAANKLRVHGLLILSSLFILLLVNFLLFSGLNTSNSKLVEQVSRTTQSTTDVLKLTDQVQQKEDLLKNLGWEMGIDKSALVDQLASLLPREIIWKEVSVDPLDLSVSRLQKEVVFFNRQIKITGIAEKIIPVNEWMARIKTRPWVKNVQMESYTYNSELNTGRFIILIDY
ncbi:PilN domain-containing protein [Mucilaginibacter sp. X4EP1]|uniref:PilN domain-containing protein n=1 Tax=Mucilaginibacter sp. X4EP1 TaxID=2723092 RepID=UPI002169ED64|nr:PilN domain-containing protein [Mucilaginibacter sp. X4EP1]MCS3816561.1 Tfp pilus assembly protein PilN [Mucilaginibacter sp. X4EP1]